MRFFYIAFLFLLSSHAVSVSSAQTIFIRGKVKNEIDSAMANVTVSIKGGKIATTTNLNGEFSIAVSKLPVYLVFSAVGYETRELLLNKKDSSKYISVSLTPATAALQEVVVSG
ncbi:MAG TPA: carboxypeptidase-like regulatory domain-containing protein, partial [Puia sp.]